MLAFGHLALLAGAQKIDLLIQIHLIESGRKQEVLANGELLLLGISLELDHHHTVEENTIDLSEVIRREREENLAQIEGHTR